MSARTLAGAPRLLARATASAWIVSRGVACRSMRYLITGGAGFIGSHLAEELLARGHRSTSSTTSRPGRSTTSATSRTTPASSYTIDTCANAPLVAELVDEADVVYHLAAAVGVELIVESPVRTIETNVHCTEVVLDAGEQEEQAGLRRLDERGLRQVARRSRSARTATWSSGPTDKGRWSYACSKAIDEFLALAYWKERKLPTVVGAPVQHRRPAPDRPLRHGRPDLRPAGAGRPADHRLRRRDAAALLLPRRRRGPRARRPDASARTPTARSSTSARSEEISILAARRARPRADRLGVRDRSSSPTRRPTRPASRTCRGGSPTSPRSRPLGWAPTKRLDEILDDVIACQRAPPPSRSPWGHSRSRSAA